MITVLLATRNGERTIGRTLEAFGKLEPPFGGWRLIVVDNGSTDGTAEVLRDHRQRLPLTVLDEPRPGKQAALNKALPQVKEGLIVFVDDDILPEPSLLRAYEAVARANPDYALFGGRIVPCWDAEPPPWIRTCVDLAVCYGIHGNIDDGPCPHYVLYGGNMAVRAEALHRGHRFNESFGPHPSPSFAMGGETEFVRLLVAAGCTTWHCGAAVVRHIIPAEHMSEAWLLNRAINFGRGQYRVRGDVLARAGDGRARIAWRLKRALFNSRWRALQTRFGGSFEDRFRTRWRLNFLKGMAAEHAAAAGPASRAPGLAGEVGEPRDPQ